MPQNREALGKCLLGHGACHISVRPSVEVGRLVGRGSSRKRSWRQEERRGEERRGVRRVFQKVGGGRDMKQRRRKNEAPSFSYARATQLVQTNLPVGGVAPPRNEMPLPNDVTGDESRLPVPPPTPRRLPMALGASPPTPEAPILPWPRVWLRSPTPAEDDAERAAAGSVPTSAAAERKRKGREGG